MPTKLLNFKNKSDTAFKIRSKSATKAEIIIYSAIGPENWFEETVSAKTFSEELTKLGNVTEIDVRINSPGGDVFDGMAIYNRLKQHKAKITVYIDGMAASIASIIALAGDEIIMGEGALYMIHLPWTMSMGNRMELENTVDRLVDVEDLMIGVYQRKTGLDRAEIRAMLEAETYMDADQAIEKGFVTAKAGDAMPIAASAFNHKWIKHAPKNYLSQTKVADEKIAELKLKLKAKIARK